MNKVVEYQLVLNTISEPGWRHAKYRGLHLPTEQYFMFRID